MDEYVERGVWRVTIALHVPYGNNDGYAWNLGSRASLDEYDVTEAVDIVVVRIALARPGNPAVGPGGRAAGRSTGLTRE